MIKYCCLQLRKEFEKVDNLKLASKFSKVRSSEASLSNRIDCIPRKNHNQVAGAGHLVELLRENKNKLMLSYQLNHCT